MDEAGSFMAKLQSSIIVPIMYKMVHTGKLPKFMQKKINEADESRKKLIDGFVNMFGIDQEMCIKDSLCNTDCSADIVCLVRMRF